MKTAIIVLLDRRKLIDSVSCRQLSYGLYVFLTVGWQTMAEKPKADIESNGHQLDSSGRHAKHKPICYNMENASN